GGEGGLRRHSSRSLVQLSERGEHMPASVGFIVIDTTDPDGLVEFWGALLDVAVDSTVGGGQFVILAPTTGGYTLTVQRVPEAKSGKKRLHLDLVVEDLDAATAELES